MTVPCVLFLHPLADDVRGVAALTLACTARLPALCCLGFQVGLTRATELEFGLVSASGFKSDVSRVYHSTLLSYAAPVVTALAVATNDSIAEVDPNAPVSAPTSGG